MPRVLEKSLAYCLDRENPYVETYVEVSAPDVSRVLQRPADQLLLAPDPLVSLTPAGGFVAAPSGGIALPSTPGTLCSFFGNSVNAMNVDQEDPNTRIKGLNWAVDPSFQRALLKSFTARLQRGTSFVGGSGSPGFELQVYRASGRMGVLTKADGTQRPFFEWDFIPLLPAPVRILPKNIAWVSNSADVVFDLTGQNLYIDGVTAPLPSSQLNGQVNYYFSIRQISALPSGSATWKMDTVSARTIAGIGTFDDVWWSRVHPADAWAMQSFGQVPNASIQIEQYNPSGGMAQGVYKLDLGRAPSAGTTGRVRFTRALPPGTAATVELSTAGTGGPWTTVNDGDAVVTPQQVYHARVTLTPDAAHRATPILAAVGVEFRAPIDVSREALLAPLARDINMPFAAATVGDGQLKVLRTGRRDFLDAATALGSTQSTTKLEVDIFLRSLHPAVTRASWLRLDRASVIDRIPGETSETYSLLSYLTMLQRKVPLPTETINSVHTVTNAITPTQLQVQVTPNLPGATVGGSEYTGKGYFVRVRSSTQPGVETGKVYLIASQSNANQINFNAGDLSGVFAVGDVLEVHSGVLSSPVLSYKDTDPADAWWDLLVNQLQVPQERIGLGHLPRGGLPPKVTDICPGDATGQAKRKVSLALDKPEAGDKLLDQLSYIMGGATVEIAGQICFVQLYALRAADATISVPLPASSRTFDPRDYFGFTFPQGLQQRASAVTASYGVDLTAPSALRAAPSQTEVADSDAINWYTLSPNDNRGRTAIPAEIARWCYSSADSGLFLATELCYQLARYFSTGLRIWDWSTRDAHPEHHAGDVVTLVTDRFTDYDPSGQTSIAGWRAISVVLIGVSNDGRKFRGIVPGLNPNSVRAVGQGGGTTGIKPPAADFTGPIAHIDPTSLVESDTAPTVTLTFTGTLTGNSAGPLSYRYRIDTPSALGSWSAPAAFPHAGLVVSRLVLRNKTVLLEVTDAASGLKDETRYVVEGWLPHIEVGTGHLRRDLQIVDASGGNTGFAAIGDASDASGGTLAAAQKIVDGSQGRTMQRGYQSGYAADGAAITFAPAYSVIPATRVSRGPGAVIQPLTASFSPAYDATKSVREDFRFTGLSASGGTINGKFRQKAAPTLRQTDFPNTTLTAVGSVTLQALNAPSQTNSYTIRWSGGVTTTSGKAGTSRTAILTVNINKRAGGPTGAKTILATPSYFVTDPDGSGPYTNHFDASLAASVTLTASDYLEVEFVSLTHTGAILGGDSATLRGGVHTDSAPDNFYGLEFTTAASADPVCTATPDTGDLMFWEAWLP